MIKLLVVCIFSVMASTTVSAADTFPRPFTMQLDHNDSTSMSGEVIDLNGAPVAHAKIAVFVTHPDFMVPVLGPTLLHECTADSVGRFTFKFASPSAFQCTRLYAIAGHSLHGFTQVELDLPRRSHEILFRLKKEQAIQGQVVGPEGQKVKGLEIDLVSVSDKQTSTSFERSSSLPEAWPKSTFTNGEGEFTFRGVPAATGNLSLSFQVNDERFGAQLLQVTLDKDGPVTLQVKQSAIVTGQVVREDSDLPISNAWLLVVPYEIGWVGDLQHKGIPVQTDVDGKFRVRCCPEKLLTVYVYPPEGEPYLAWVIDAKRWPTGKSVFDLRIEVPRGVLVRGKVIASTTGKPIVGAGIEYWVARDKTNSQLSSGFLDKAYWAAEYRRVLSDSDGSFQQVVVPGPGYLVAKAPDSSFVSRQITHGDLQWDKPGGFFVNVESAKSINPEPKEETIDVVMEMKPGVTVRGRVEGPDGLPVSRVNMLSVSFTRVQSVTLSSRRELLAIDGMLELPGCDPEESRTIFLLDAKAQLGATAILSPSEYKEKPPVIRLLPCGWATVQLLDKQGSPLRNQSLNAKDLILKTDLIGKEGVINPKYGIQALRNIQWGMSILDSERHKSLQTDDNGRVTLPTLIPGAPYKLIQHLPSYKELIDFRVESGKELDLGQVTIE